VYINIVVRSNYVHPCGIQP